MCQFPASANLFGALACYDDDDNTAAVSSLAGSFVASHAGGGPLELLIVGRMARIAALAAGPGVATGMLMYAVDTHFPALFRAMSDPATTVPDLYADGLAPEASSVHSHFEIHPRSARLSALISDALPPVRTFTSRRAPVAAPQPSDRLFEQAGPGCKSVRYISERLRACVAAGGECAAVAASVASLFLLGAYAHAEPLGLMGRESVYHSPDVVSMLLAGAPGKISSRELHGALLEHAIVARGERCVEDRPEWRRARERARGSLSGSARGRPMLPQPQYASPVARLASAAAPGGVWSVSRAGQALATAAMAGLGPPRLWASARDAGRLLCGSEPEVLVEVMLGTREGRLSSVHVAAASMVIRRLALQCSRLSGPVARAQWAAVRRAGRSRAGLSVCTNCCTICTTPRGDAPVAPGVRVDLVTGDVCCVRCSRSDGVLTVELVGKILTYATASVALVRVVVCCGCAAITVLGCYWGLMPVCPKCHVRCKESVALPGLCFCGRPAAPGACEFPARSASGADVMVAACRRHQYLVTRERQSVSDLCWLASI